jgi:hypothetical protein
MVGLPIFNAHPTLLATDLFDPTTRTPPTKTYEARHQIVEQTVDVDGPPPLDPP